MRSEAALSASQAITMACPRFASVRESTAEASDARCKTMGEVLGAMRLIKCQARPAIAHRSSLYGAPYRSATCYVLAYHSAPQLAMARHAAS